MNDLSGLCGLLVRYLHGLGWLVTVLAEGFLFAVCVAVPVGLWFLFTWTARVREHGPDRPRIAYDGPLRAYAVALAALLLACTMLGFASAIGNARLAAWFLGAVWEGLGAAVLVGPICALATCILGIRGLVRERNLVGAWFGTAATLAGVVAASVPSLIGLIVLGVDRACRDAFFADLARYNAANCDGCHGPDPTWSVLCAGTMIAAAVVYAIVVWAAARGADPPRTETPPPPDAAPVPAPATDGGAT